MTPGPFFTEAREALAEAARIATIVEAFVVLVIFASIMLICATPERALDTLRLARAGAEPALNSMPVNDCQREGK